MSDPTPQEIAASFNATNVVITVEDGVENESKFTFFQAGPQTAFVANTSGTVDIGGVRGPRSYLYTWVTAFGEESIPSRPSESVYSRVGETVLVSNLPTEYVSPDGKPRLVRGIRFYRSIATPGGTEYLRLATLWFPNKIVRASQTGDEVSAESLYPHTLVVGDRIAVPDGFFQASAGEVLRVINRFQFVYRASNPAEITPLEVDNTFYYDVSEDPTGDEPFFWGLPNYGLDPYVFRDDFDQLALTRILPSLNYAPPPEDLQGLTLLPTNIMAGFVGSNLYLSEPGEYHAWPTDNILSFDHKIVGLAVNAGTLVVLTDGYPSRVDGSTPESMQANKVESMYPCLSKKSIVGTGMGVVYATHSGLALYSPAQGADRITRFVLDREDWLEQYDPALVKGFEYEDKYIATSPVGSFAFERDEQVGGVFVKLEKAAEQPFDPAGGWTDPSSGNLYLSEGQITGVSGDIEFSDTTTFLGSGWTHNVTIAYAPAANQFYMSLGTGFGVFSEVDGSLIRTFETGYIDNHIGAVSPDGRYLARGARGFFGTPFVSVFDTVSGSEVLVTTIAGLAVRSTAFSPDGNFFHCVGKVYSVPDFQEVASFVAFASSQAVFTADSKYLLHPTTVPDAPGITSWVARDTTTWEVAFYLDVPSSAHVPKVSESGSVIAFLDIPSSPNMSLYLVDSDTFTQLPQSPIEFNASTFAKRAGIAFFGNDRFIYVTASSSSGHRVVDTETGQAAPPPNANQFFGVSVFNVKDRGLLLGFHNNQGSATHRFFPLESGLGISQFDEGALLDMTWQSKDFRFPVPMGLGALQVYADNANTPLSLQVNSVFRGATETDAYQLSGGDLRGVIRRMPLRGKYDEFSFRVQGALSVKTIRFATSPTELTKV